MPIRLLSFFCFLLFSVHSLYADEAPIKIAFAGPLAGPYGAYGKQMWESAQLAVQVINETGGIHGRPLQLIPADDQCNPVDAMQHAENLTRNAHVSAVIGHVCSNASLVVADQYASANVLMITPSSTNPKLTQKGIPTLFRMCGRDDLQAQVPTDFLLNKLRAKKIAILHDQDVYSKDFAEHVIAEMREAELSPTLYQGIPRGSHQFNELIQQFKKLQIEAVFFAGLYPEVGKLAKSMYEEKLQIPLLSADGVVLDAFVTTAGTPTAAAATMMSFNADPRIIAQDHPAVQKLKGESTDIGGYALYAYAAVQVIAEAMRQSNPNDGKALAHWLHQNQVSTILGPMSWDTNGDIMNSNYVMYIWNNQGQYDTLQDPHST